MYMDNKYYEAAAKELKYTCIYIIGYNIICDIHTTMFDPNLNLIF